MNFTGWVRSVCFSLTRYVESDDTGFMRTIPATKSAKVARQAATRAHAVKAALLGGIARPRSPMHAERTLGAILATGERKPSQCIVLTDREIAALRLAAQIAKKI